MLNRRCFGVLAVLVTVGAVLTACAQPTPEVIEKTVVITKEVMKEGEVVVETAVVTATPPPTAKPTAVPPVEMGTPVDTYVYATIGDPQSLDPAWQYDNASGGVIFNVYDPLIFPKREAFDAFVPALATSWEVSDDGLTYSFQIREGVTFHEGGSLEPHDVAYSVWRGMLQDRAGGPQWMMLESLMGVGHISDVGEIGDPAVCEQVKETVSYDDQEMTVEMHLVEPAGFWLQIVAGTWIVPLDQEWVSDNGGWDGNCETWGDYYDPAAEASVLFEQTNGTGPFKLEQWVHGEEVSLVRYEDYYRTEPIWEGGPSGPAQLERGVIKTVDEWGTRFSMLQAGDVDVVYVPRQYISQVDPLVKESCDGVTEACDVVNPDGVLRRYTGLPNNSSVDAFFTFQINTEGGNPYIGSGELDGNGIPPDFFADINIRRAFNYCFDWKTMIEEVWFGEAFRRTGPIIAGMAGHVPPEEAEWVYEYDLEKCAEAFKKADLDHDGIPAGEDEEGDVWTTGFYFNLNYNTGNDQRRSMAEIMAQGVEAVNDKFSIAVFDLPWPTYLEQMVTGRLPAFYIGWLEDYHHPHNWVTPYMSSHGTFSAWQFFPDEMYSAFDEKIREAKVLPIEDAGPAYEDLQRLAMENAIDIFVGQPVGRRYEQPWCQGWYFNPTYGGNNWFYGLSKEVQ